jgi:hypothetical protein
MCAITSHGRGAPASQRRLTPLVAVLVARALAGPPAGLVRLRAAAAAVRRGEVQRAMQIQQPMHDHMQIGTAHQACKERVPCGARATACGAADEAGIPTLFFWEP